MRAEQMSNVVVVRSTPNTASKPVVRLSTEQYVLVDKIRQ